MSTPTIHEIDVPIEGQNPQKIGFRHDNKDVYIYMVGAANLEDNIALDPAASLAKLLQSAQQLLFPKTPLHEVKWHLRSGSAVSEVKFTPDKHGEPVRMQVSNMYASYAMPEITVADYQQDRFKEFNPGPRVLEIPPPKMKDDIFIQKRPDGKQYMFRHGENSSFEKDVVVYVDAKKFMEAMQKFNANQATPSAHALNDWAPDKIAGTTQPLSKIDCKDQNGVLYFGINAGPAGHLMSLCRSGVESFPVAVDRNQAQLLLAVCGKDRPAQPNPRVQNLRPPC